MQSVETFATAVEILGICSLELPISFMAETGAERPNAANETASIAPLRTVWHVPLRWRDAHPQGTGRVRRRHAQCSSAIGIRRTERRWMEPRLQI